MRRTSSDWAWTRLPPPDPWQQHDQHVETTKLNPTLTRLVDPTPSRAQAQGEHTRADVCDPPPSAERVHELLLRRPLSVEGGAAVAPWPPTTQGLHQHHQRFEEECSGPLVAQNGTPSRDVALRLQQSLPDQPPCFVDPRKALRPMQAASDLTHPILITHLLGGLSATARAALSRTGDAVSMGSLSPEQRSVMSFVA